MLSPTNKKPPRRESKPVPDEARERFINETVTFSSVLPSGFKPYSGKKEITYDTYTMLEVKKLSSGLPVWQKYALMLEGIKSKDMDVSTLTFNDFEFLNVHRKMSIPDVSEYEVPFMCPVHGEQKFRFNLSTMGFQSLDWDVPIIETLSNGVEIQVMPLTIGSLIQLLKNDLYFLKHDDEYITDEKGNMVVDEIALWASSIINMPFNEAYDVISKSPNPYDQELLEEVDKKLDHGLIPLTCVCQQKIGKPSKEYLQKIEEWRQYERDVRNKKVKAGKPKPRFHIYDDRKSCGHEVQIRLQGGESLIYPFRDTDVSGES